jgi:hypothetical protein
VRILCVFRGWAGRLRGGFVRNPVAAGPGRRWGAGLIVGWCWAGSCTKLGIFVSILPWHSDRAPFSNAPAGHDVGCGGAAGLVCGLNTLVLINLMVMAAHTHGRLPLSTGWRSSSGDRPAEADQDPNHYGVLAATNDAGGHHALVGASASTSIPSNKPWKKKSRHRAPPESPSTTAACALSWGAWMRRPPTRAW